jgi:hypothetical protein
MVIFHSKGLTCRDATPQLRQLRQRHGRRCKEGIGGKAPGGARGTTQKYEILEEGVNLYVNL